MTPRIWQFTSQFVQSTWNPYKYSVFYLTASRLRLMNWARLCYTIQNENLQENNFSCRFSFCRTGYPCLTLCCFGGIHLQRKGFPICPYYAIRAHVCYFFARNWPITGRYLHIYEHFVVIYRQFLRYKFIKIVQRIRFWFVHIPDREPRLHGELAPPCRKGAPLFHEQF